MMLKLPAPRLLPMTITTLSVLLVVKCGVLVQAALSDGRRPGGVVVTSANAANADQDHAKPAGGKSPPLSPPPAEPPKGEPAKGDVAKGDVAKGNAAKGNAGHDAAPRPSGPNSGATSGATSGANAQQADGPPPVSESEKAILQNLRQRRKELDAREVSVTTRESVLAASEQKLTERVGELQALQKKLEGLDAEQKQKEDAGWQGMVKLYEAMKPKDAATIFNELSMPILLQVMDRMKDAKAAAIMAAMSPDKARDVTSELAELRTGHNTTADRAGPGLKLNPLGG